jgi:hypothetical protein
MKGIAKYISVFSLAMSVMGCVEPYLPAIVEENPQYLVVNGMLNLDGTAEIRLTTTTNINSKEAPPAVSQAVVTIETDDNNSFQLSESRLGQYLASGLSLNSNTQYRLRIKANGEEYLSEFVPMKNSPPIDSVTYFASGEGIDINVHTHDPSGESRYYKWSFAEAWEYRAEYYSTHRLINNVLVPRPVEDLRYICYKNQMGAAFTVESTTRFFDDRVSNLRVTTIEPQSEKVSRRYSILVKQQVLTEDGYHYWETLKKTTEQVGGLFDPLPSSIDGNIQCISNSSRKAIGFFTASGVSEKRLFISSRDISPSYPRYFVGVGCLMDSVIFEPNVDYGSSENVVAPIMDQIFIIGFTFSTSGCVDCTLHGGVVTKPEFWDQ